MDEVERNPDPQYNKVRPAGLAAKRAGMAVDHPAPGPSEPSRAQGERGDVRDSEAADYLTARAEAQE